MTTAGRTIVFVNLLDTVRGRDVSDSWTQVRNMINDNRPQFPQGVQGPFFNDRFGDVFGNIYAFTSDGLSQRQMRDLVEDARAKVLTVPNVGRVDIVGADALVKLSEIGPPVGRPLQYRVSGSEIQQVRQIAREVAKIAGDHPNLGTIVYDWMEPARLGKVELLQNKARELGLSNTEIAQVLNGVVEGTAITQVRDDIYLVNVVARAELAERGSIETLRNLQLSGPAGSQIPLAAVATFDYTLEQPLIWRRDRIPTITVKAGVLGAIQPPEVMKALAPTMESYAATLPAGYHVEGGGSAEESANAPAPNVAVVPMMLFAMATILMLQFQSFSRLFVVFAVDPLAIIGVVAALLPTGTPMGFVAILGVLALIGILIRNSVILIVQIEDLRREGAEDWAAVVEATEHRMRPILLTAAAASLALIPISR
jgi:multidrug efflux pump subunit AcrB